MKQEAVKFESYTSNHTLYSVSYQLNNFLKSHLNYNIKLIEYNHPIASNAEKEELFVIFDVEEVNDNSIVNNNVRSE